MERFKRGEHASHLIVCGMFGYVQSRTSEEWITKVNTWISELAQSNVDPRIDWNYPNEKLSHYIYLPDVQVLKSVNNRAKSQDSILIYHYFINLC